LFRLGLIQVKNHKIVYAIELFAKQRRTMRAIPGSSPLWF
jgi:hypothetical protein